MRRYLLGCAALTTLLAPASIAAAQETRPPVQEDAAALDDVVVTARLREERLSDVPVAASVLDADALANRGGATSALEVLSGQAGVRFFNTSSPVNSEISIRASPTARATNADPSIGLYRDGAYIGGGTVGGRSYSRTDLFDIGRIEILRGTQGALYGRNAVGGAINVIAAQPVFENTGWVDLKYGVENESPQAQAVVNFAVSDYAAVRFGVDYIDQRGGFFYNPQNDVYFDQQQSLGLRGQIRIRHERTDTNLLFERQEGDIPAITFRVVIPAQAAFPFGVTQPAYEYPWSLAPLATQDINNLNFTVKHRFDWATLTSITAYRTRDSFYQFDADGTNPVTLAADRAAGRVLIPIDAGADSLVSDDTRLFSQNVFLTGLAFDDRLDWLVGAEIFRLDSDSVVTNLRTPTPANLSLGNRSPATLTYDSWAVYGSLGFDVTDSFNLSGEVRYTADEKSLSARRFDAGTGVAIGGTGFVVDAETSPDNVSYNLIAAFDLPADLLLFGKIGSSYRSGGFNTNLGVSQQPVAVVPAYDDETTDSYELGLKGRMLGIRFGLAAYLNQTDNLIVQTDNGCFIGNPVCSLNAVSFLTNAGEAESKGVEFEASTRQEFAGGEVGLGLNMSVQEGEITSGVYAGQPLAQVPDFIIGADVNYRRAFIGDSVLLFNLNYNGQRGGLQELIRPGTVTPNYDVEDIDILNGRIAVQVGKVEYAIYGTNLMDSEFALFASPTTERLNQPRNYGFQVRYRW